MGAELPVMPQGWPHTSGRRKRGRGAVWDDAKKARFRQMWNDDVRVEEMSDVFESSRGAIYQRARMDPQCKMRRKNGLVKGRSKRRDGGRQRRFTGATVEPGHQPRVVLQPHHPASRLGTTVFPGTVVPASRVPKILKSGEESRKIGKVVEKGRWKGFPIVTLTLVERETCPRSCLEWATCYGNNMHMAQRILDDGTLARRLFGELASLNAKYRTGFVVRLHVLGDFYSVDYVEAWRGFLAEFPALNIFGFTARRPPDPIGGAVVRLVADHLDRVSMRFSGAGFETDSSEVVERAEDATGIICPAQRDEKRSCASCALCWQSNRTISFLKH